MFEHQEQLQQGRSCGHRLLLPLDNAFGDPWTVVMGSEAEKHITQLNGAN